MTASIALACLLVSAICSCSSRGTLTGSDANKTSRPALDFTLVNVTGSTLHAIYVSPHDSAGWEENVLGRDELLDSETVEIRFNPEEKSLVWDIRAEDGNGTNAEWKNLNLRDISKITLRLGQDVVVAEAE
jgi:hypothetical protein